MFCYILEIFDFFVNKESSNVNEAIKAISNLFIFFTRKFYTHKKHKNSGKSTKTQTSEKATFFPLDVFYAHKNAAFFVFGCVNAFCACEIFS